MDINDNGEKNLSYSLREFDRFESVLSDYEGQAVLFAQDIMGHRGYMDIEYGWHQ